MHVRQPPSRRQALCRQNFGDASNATSERTFTFNQENEGFSFGAATLLRRIDDAVARMRGALKAKGH